MTEKSNPACARTAQELKKIAKENDAPVWKLVAEMLMKSRSSWAEVNIGKLQDHGGKAHVSGYIIPGKLLGGGELKKKVTVAAFSHSASAARKIADAGGEFLPVLELAQKHPKGTGIAIFR